MPGRGFDWHMWGNLWADVVRLSGSVRVSDAAYRRGVLRTVVNLIASGRAKALSKDFRGVRSGDVMRSAIVPILYQWWSRKREGHYTVPVAVASAQILFLAVEMPLIGLVTAISSSSSSSSSSLLLLLLLLRISETLAA